jgi:iron complex outermembrane receptor protein
MGPVTGFAAKRSLSGTKTDTPVLEIPQSISVIGRDEMNARGVQNAMDAVRYTPGVITNINGPDNRGWEDISIRGFPAGLSIYQNGLAQSPFNVTNYISDPYMFERVEVLRGPSSMIFGQGDAGGITNRVTKLASGERNREIELQIGNHQRKQLAFDIGDRFGETSDWSYRLIGVGLDSNDEDRYPDGHKLNRTRTVLAPSLQWKPSARTSLTLYGEYIKNSSAEDTYFVPDKELRPTALKMGDYSFSAIAQQQKSIGYRFQHEFADGWTVRQNYRFSQLELHRRVVWTTGLQEDGRTLDRVARTWNDPMSQSVMDTSVEGKFKTGSVQHTMLWGRRLQPAEGLGEPVPRSRAHTGLLHAGLWPIHPLSDHAAEHLPAGHPADRLLPAGPDQVRRPLGAHARRPQGPCPPDHQRPAEQQPHHPARQEVQRPRRPHLPVRQRCCALHQLRRIVPAQRRPRRRQEPLQTHPRQAGGSGRQVPTAGSRLLLTAAVFDLRKSNVVSFDPETFEGRQIGKVRSRGIELEAKGELLPGLSISGSYTRMNVKVTSSSDPEEIGKGLPEKPKEIASVWLDYTMGNGLGSAAAYATWAGAPATNTTPSSRRATRCWTPPFATNKVRGAMRSTCPTSATRSTSRAAMWTRATAAPAARSR